MGADDVVFPSRNETGSTSLGSSTMFDQRTSGRPANDQPVLVQLGARADPLLRVREIHPKVTRVVLQPFHRAGVRTLALWEVRAPVMCLAVGFVWVVLGMSPTT